GENWVTVNGSLTNPLAISLAINSDDHIFAGLDGLFGLAGVIRSTDNGTNWTILSNGFTATNNVNALAINSNGHVFAGTYGDGIFRSTDNGDSWSPVLNSTHTVSLAFNSNDILFAGHFLGDRKSTRLNSSHVKISYAVFCLKK